VTTTLTKEDIVKNCVKTCQHYCRQSVRRRYNTKGKVIYLTLSRKKQVRKINKCNTKCPLRCKQNPDGSVAVADVNEAACMCNKECGLMKKKVWMPKLICDDYCGAAMPSACPTTQGSSALAALGAARDDNGLELAGADYTTSPGVAPFALLAVVSAVAVAAMFRKWTRRTSGGAGETAAILAPAATPAANYGAVV